MINDSSASTSSIERRDEKRVRTLTVVRLWAATFATKVLDVEILWPYRERYPGTGANKITTIGNGHRLPAPLECGNWQISNESPRPGLPGGERVAFELRPMSPSIFLSILNCPDGVGRAVLSFAEITAPANLDGGMEGAPYRPVTSGESAVELQDLVRRWPLGLCQRKR
ncbi:pilus assembly protein CpaE [Anopheles sinensis]|uniref:Pilus assembly protein CpaE n=1 Tax=Anopheles sinensis TaxID=74873 RepID=A0A084VV22_ANOSI|nr:pilus assembly protein CpaE [Anopheles sinensis]